MAGARLSLGSLLTIGVSSVLLWAALASTCLLVGSTGWGIPTEALLRARLIDNVLPASLIGAGLAVAGVIYQSLLRNPLADPYLLGVASGATLGKVVWLLPAWTWIPVVAATGQQTAAFVGGLGAIAVVLFLASRRGRLDPTTLLLTGVVVSAIVGAALLFCVSLSRVISSSTALSVDAVLLGGVPTNISRAQGILSAALVLGGLAVAQAMAPMLAVSTLSDAEAAALGLRLNRLRWAALALASLITSASVALAGPIGFVGLVCPHLARLIVGPDPRRTLLVSAALGAALLSVADGICRLLNHSALLNTLLPTGVLTAMIGGPFFLALLWRERRKEAAT